MRMAARRRRTWIATGGATAAVAIGVWAAIALGAPALTAPGMTHLPVNLSWSDGAATGFTLSRAPGTCSRREGPPWTFRCPCPPRPPSQTRLSTGATATSSPPPTPTLRCPSPGADVWVDNTPPTPPAVNFVPAPAGSALRGTVTVNASSSDAGGTGVASYIISVDGGGPLPTAQWNTAQVADGAHTLHVTAVDNVGLHSTTTDVAVVVKNTAPPRLGSALCSLRSREARRSPGFRRSGRPTPSRARGRPHRSGAAAVDGPGNARAWHLPLRRHGQGRGRRDSDLVGRPGRGHPAERYGAPWGLRELADEHDPASRLAAADHVRGDRLEDFPRRIRATVLGDAAAASFDDTSLTAQGPHVYSVQALSGGAAGDMSSPVSVTYDTVAPELPPASASSNPNGSVLINWAAADDPAPGSGVASYVVRRGTTAPGSPTAGTAICTLSRRHRLRRQHGEERNDLWLRCLRDRRGRQRRPAHDQWAGVRHAGARSRDGLAHSQLRPHVCQDRLDRRSEVGRRRRLSRDHAAAAHEDPAQPARRHGRVPRGQPAGQQMRRMDLTPARG